MKETKELSEILQLKLSINKARALCLAMLLVGLINSWTVNLAKISVKVRSDAKVESVYRRFQNFFRYFSFPQEILSKYIVSLFFEEGRKLELTLDRTNWKWGKKDINFLVLAAIYKGTAIPVVWFLLDKKGNSNTAERKELITKFINIFGADKVDSLVGDREFIGKEWFEFLQFYKINFVMRLKKDTLFKQGKKTKRAARLFKKLNKGEMHVIPKVYSVWGLKVYLSAVRPHKGELVMLISPNLDIDPIDAYKKRWEIETLFACLKSRGFNFEDTHITNLKRLSTLFGVVAIAFAWAHRVGEWKIKNVKPITIKKHKRKQSSIFRYGLNMLSNLLFSFPSQFSEFIPILDCNSTINLSI